MKKILISQRRDQVLNRDEVRDGMDVRFASIFYELGYMPIPLCSDLYNAEGYIEELKPDAIFIGSGNDIGEQPRRDLLEVRLLDYAKDHNIPVLGICRGAQFINHYFGGATVAVNGHVGLRHRLLGDWVVSNGYNEVNSYHNFAITKDSLAKDLDILAVTEDGVVEAIRHKVLPWLGIMWHPEREPAFSATDKRVISEHFNS